MIGHHTRFQENGDLRPWRGSAAKKKPPFSNAAGPRHGSKSPFSRKRVWRPIIFFCCFELSSTFLYVK